MAMAGDGARILDRLLQSLAGDEVLATLVRVEGRGYRSAGARLLLQRGRVLAGDMGGGCLQEELALVSERVAHTQRSELRVYDLEERGICSLNVGCPARLTLLLAPAQHLQPLIAAWRRVREERIALDCQLHLSPQGDLSLRVAEATGAEAGPSWEEREGGGVYRERLSPPPRAWLLGAGEEAHHLANLLPAFGYAIHVVDHRPALLTRARFPQASLHPLRPEHLTGNLEIAEEDAAVVMYHQFTWDRTALETLLGTPASYLGLIGSSRRAESILADLPGRERVHAPAGYRLRAEGALPVALGVLLELTGSLGPAPHHLEVRS